MVVRLNLLLLLLAVGSALALVRVQYDSRRLYSELDKEVRLARQLETEFEALQVMLRAQAAAARVDQFARTDLQMRAATPATTRYVHEPATRTQRVQDQAGFAVSEGGAP
ncbi:cell division protein FtsL [Allofranklinella schreckenbergeri]|uniref:Cell division protein FtsL n=1 Tax=Allofranklinella schreckenbergeri TaxID=1076744 RepID=A0A3M6R4C7_9BURK|nr:cell division protein FtsL [Allofranklinella schreckenbergeri]MDO4704894.1 cell division protein FtsL [Comamonadaceae bacterium]RMX10005.1 cell division protein FtsL [Allofranklinella schreckenbergeri]